MAASDGKKPLTFFCEKGSVVIAGLGSKYTSEYVTTFNEFTE